MILLCLLPLVVARTLISITLFFAVLQKLVVVDGNMIRCKVFWC